MKATAIVALCLTLASGLAPGADGPTEEPQFVEGKLAFPAHYREWVYLSTGYDMSYRPMGMPGHHTFDNVFVEPGAYRSFLKTGTWPDKTLLVLELRGATSRGSINKSGSFQGGEVMGVEVHVRDSARFEGQWGFFAFGAGTAPVAMIPVSAECYACHAEHAAVDKTFVQFYPTLLPVATAKGTLSPAYLAQPAH